jgi:tetratricopeptide (TPR) repeat protein/DNA-binding winged helix-turn-helix (wHTH) protein
MTEPSTRSRRRTQNPVDAPIFPRPVPTYVGRDAELERALGHLDDETLHLIYGVGGVGKSEFVFRVVEALRARPRWQDARALLVSARPGMAPEHLVASLAAVAGARRPRTELQTSAESSLDDDLATAARALERAPALVFVDDLHHLDPTAAGYVLGYLSRRVRGSRIFAASQVELVLPVDSPPPVVYRLGPLDRSDTAALVARLAERLDTPPPDAAAVFDRTGGSPFQVLRDLAGDRDAGRSGLDQTIRDLDPGTRGLLLALACARTRIRADEAAALAGADAVHDLGRRFLIDTRQRGAGAPGPATISIHDLIRDAAMKSATRRDIAAAHRLVADLYAARGDASSAASGGGDPDGSAGGAGAEPPWRSTTGRGPDPNDVVEIVHHLVRAGDVDDAWETCERGYRAIAAAGLDHLLLDDLRALAGVLPEARPAITLLNARILVRRSLIVEAAEMLDTVGASPDNVRWLLLTGEVAHRRGRMQEAESYFRRALEIATDRGDRLQAGIELADVSTLRGNGDDARAVLADVAATHGPLSPRERARWGWSNALSYLIEERFADSVVAARAAADAIAGQGLDDLEALIAMLELIGRSECDDVIGARALIERCARLASAGALRERMIAGYRGVVEYHAGDLPAARESLGGAFAHLVQHADHTLGSIAGYYLVRVHLAIGDIPTAIDVAQKIGRLATAAELNTLAPHSRAALAEALLEADRPAEARAAAEAALIAPRRCDQTLWIATVLLARLAAADGDVGLARRALAEVAAKPIVSTGRGTASGDFIGSDLGDGEIKPADPIAEDIFARARQARDAALAIEGAWIELLGGDPAAAAERAGVALAHYTAVERRGLEARAAVLRALGLIASGDRTESAQLVERAAVIADTTAHSRVAALVGLARAALAARKGQPPASAIAGTRPDLRHTEGRALAAVLAEVEPAPGLRALLSSLGLVAGMRYRVIGRSGARVVSDAELERLRTGHRLVVEPSRAAITATAPGVDPRPEVGTDEDRSARRAVRVDRGRPLACELLAALVEGQGAVVPAETLFLGVWGGREYHPLRHRNTLYVAIKRLRTTLRTLLDEDREIIETAAGGWRLADGVDAIVIRPVEETRAS